jgi:Fe-S oxidoreductase/nitrate reductase gamma subunit
MNGDEMPSRQGDSRLFSAPLALWAAVLGVAGTGTVMVAALPENVAHREVYFNIKGAWAIYPMLAMLVSTLIFLPFQRSRLWRLGRPVSPTDNLNARFRNMIIQGFAQHRVRRDTFAAIYHMLIFLSIVNLFIVTTIILIDSEFITPLAGEPALQGPVYKGYSLYGDLAGLIGIIGCLMAFYRRYISNSNRLQTPEAEKSSLKSMRGRYIGNDARVKWMQNWTDHVILWLLFWLLVGGFVTEGARIAATELREGHESWSYWSPVGWVFASALDALGVSRDAELLIHRIGWWSHIPVVFAWLALIAFTKLGHIFMAPANAFFMSLTPYGRLPYDADLTKEEAQPARETFGVGRVQDFTWKQLFESDVCVRCGRCSSACPANIAEQPLSPMKIIQDVRKELSAVGPLVLEAREKGVEEPGAGTLVARVTEESLWACRTCGACVQECPVFIEHIPTIVDMRRWLAMDEGRMPETALAAVQNIEQRGHPWRGTAFTRTSWMEEMNVPEFDGTQEYLYWVGCTGALVERALKITQSVVRLLQEAKVSFGVIGAQETCNGDPARRLGNEYLYQMLVQQNVEAFNALAVRKVIVHCPHCFNTFKNEYPDFGAKLEVIHHSVLLDHLVKAGRLQPKRSVGRSITFHDPCYLGRHNGIYEQPRGVIEAIPGASLVEMPRSQSKSYCCGAGGGNIWMEEKVGRRVNQVRTEEAINTGADIVAVGCPFCIQMFEDAIPALQPDDTKRIKAYDIAELLEVSVIDKSIADRRMEATSAGD